MEGLSSQIRDAGGVELEPDARGGEEAGAGGRPWQGHLVRHAFFYFCQPREGSPGTSLFCTWYVVHFFIFVDQEKGSQE